jgi:predicted RNA-binding Zn ribbon-like protein
MPAVTTISEMDLDGGVACLDFINSGLNTNAGDEVERLHGYQDILILVKRLSLMEPRAIRALSAAAAIHPRKAQEILTKTLHLRHILHTIIGAIADNKVPQIDRSALNAFNDYISSALSTRRFAIGEGTLQWKDAHTAYDLLHPLHLFILSAWELIRNAEHSYIRRCGRCQWLFLDTTKNHRRKWCSMRECGSLEKAKRHYRRKK